MHQLHQEWDGVGRNCSISLNQVFSFNHPKLEKVVTIEIQEFNEEIQSFIETLKNDLQIIHRKGFQHNLDGILMVGKTCQIPKIQETLKNFFPNVPQFFYDKHISVSRGAVLHGAKFIETKDSKVYYKF